MDRVLGILMSKLRLLYVNHELSSPANDITLENIDLLRTSRLLIFHWFGFPSIKKMISADKLRAEHRSFR
jgi:hypothetical protein